ncbi:lysoplasmalogenase family protein [Microbulbifer magnicolonia]|uniref:lysoplasmalogenase family protein n=1 Tax=Microbulbifer magnicolonia TaxID=3109744 RepID=UPI002B4089CB|nr:lysoplasmalogenase family protein [Microbulbifer sp. GG15]
MTITHNSASSTALQQTGFRLPVVFVAFAAIYMALDATGLRGPWMASLKIVPIAILALIALRDLAGLTRTLTLAALALSALGDVLLALQFPNQFVFGLGAFLLAQLIYAGNFLRSAARLEDWRNRRTLLRGLPVLVAALLLALLLLPAAGALAPAVLVYLVAIVAMALSAAAHRGDSALLFAGAVTFMVSDTLIALNKFIAPLPLAGTAIMLTYYGAQMALLYGIARARA